jgi:hypothetical protein
MGFKCSATTRQRPVSSFIASAQLPGRLRSWLMRCLDVTDIPHLDYLEAVPGSGHNFDSGSGGSNRCTSEGVMSRARHA